MVSVEARCISDRADRKKTLKRIFCGTVMSVQAARRDQQTQTHSRNEAAPQPGVEAAGGKPLLDRKKTKQPTTGRVLMLSPFVFLLLLLFTFGFLDMPVLPQCPGHLCRPSVPQRL